MQESRLFKILYCLLRQGHVSAPELAKELEVSVRTIYRDIDALSGAGIPVFTETGRNGGIYLMDDFILDRTILSSEEKQEILSALQGISIAPDIEDSGILRKLSSLFQMQSDTWLEVDYTRWGDKSSDKIKFDSLKSAILQRRCVKISYTSSHAQTTERIIHPLKLLYKGRAWYLKAYCTKRQEFRLFKLNRILCLEVLNEIFPYCSFPETDEDSPVAYEQQVTLCFPSEMAYRVYDEFSPEQVTLQDDDTLLVCAKMPVDDWLVGFLLSFGPNVTVLSPTDLKNDLAEWARLTYEKVKDSAANSHLTRHPQE